MSALPTHQPNPSAQSANAYLRTRVMTASPEELRLMLLDGALKFARQGREGLIAKNIESMYSGVSQCRNIVFELLTTVREDLDPELASNVKALYTFIYKTLVDASFERDLQKLDTSIELLEYERETWVLLMQKLAEERGEAKPATLPEQKPTPQKLPQQKPEERKPLSLQG